MLYFISEEGLCAAISTREDKRSKPPMARSLMTVIIQRFLLRHRTETHLLIRLRLTKNTHTNGPQLKDL